MRKTPRNYLSQYRKPYHLQLKDVAYLLQISESSLSRFEVGKSQNPKAVLGYHYLFNMSIANKVIPEILVGSGALLLKRCDELLEVIGRKSKSKKNLLRIKGINAIKRRILTNEDLCTNQTEPF